MLLSVQKDYRDVIAHLARAYCQRTVISCVGNRVQEVQTKQRRLVDISAISHVFLPGFAAKQINCAIIAAFSYAAGEIKSTALSMYLANRQNANGSRRKYSRVTRFTEMYQHTSI